MTHTPLTEAASLWRDTAPAGAAPQQLTSDVQADVAIIGGGYTGLSTAHALARDGVDTVVIEANRLGWGASGRNGGVVSGKFRLSFAEMARRWDIATARRMHDIGIESIENIAALLAELQIDAEYHERGSLRCAHRPEALSALQDECIWLRETLGDDRVSILDRDAMMAETGSPDFCGGLMNLQGGVIHPLRFIRGLASGLRIGGVRIFDESPVTSVERLANGGVRLITPQGEVRAAQMVLATNGYSGLTPASDLVRRRMVPFRSAIIATQPLTGTFAEALLSEGRSYTETRRMMRWFRKSGDRLLYGGRGAFGKTDSASAYVALETAMRRQFPQLDSLEVTHHWSGLVAMTMDSLPHVGRLDDRTVFAIGYNGAGVALASYMGRHVAAMIQNRTSDAGLMGRLPLSNVPFYPAREIGIRLVAGWYQLLDAVGK